MGKQAYLRPHGNRSLSVAVIEESRRAVGKVSAKSWGDRETLFVPEAGGDSYIRNLSQPRNRLPSRQCDIIISALLLKERGK